MRNSQPKRLQLLRSFSGGWGEGVGCRRLLTRWAEKFRRGNARSGAVFLVLSAQLLSPDSIGLGHRTTETPTVVEEPSSVDSLADALARCRRSLTKAERWRIAEAIDEESKRYGYDPFFVMALIEVESTCSPTARGRRGAVGLIQIKPSTARPLAKQLGLPWAGARTLERPEINMRLGLRYLWQLEQQFGDPVVAMAAYNMGPGRVQRMPRHRARSARYVRKILDRYERLLRRYPPERA